MSSKVLGSKLILMVSMGIMTLLFLHKFRSDDNI